MSVKVSALVAGVVLLALPTQALAENSPPVSPVFPTSQPVVESTPTGPTGIPMPALKSSVRLSGRTCGKIVDGKQACLETSPSRRTATELKRIHDNAIKPADVIPLPDWCYNFSDAWYLVRTESCAISDSSYTIYDTTTGLPVGGLDFVFWWFSFTSADQRNWQSQVEFEPITQPWDSQ
jgi:hypothetical protein